MKLWLSWNRYLSNCAMSLIYSIMVYELLVVSCIVLITTLCLYLLLYLKDTIIAIMVDVVYEHLL